MKSAKVMLADAAQPEYIRSNPWTSVGIAVAAGLIGFIAGKRRERGMDPSCNAARRGVARAVSDSLTSAIGRLRAARWRHAVAENDRRQRRRAAAGVPEQPPAEEIRVREVEAVLPTVMPLYQAARS